MVKRSPPSLLEPGVWTDMAYANVWEPMREKRAKIHRGSRRRTIEPHYEAGYTSAVVTIILIQPTCCNRAGSIYDPYIGSPWDGSESVRKAAMPSFPPRASDEGCQWPRYDGISFENLLTDDGYAIADARKMYDHLTA